MLCSSHIECKVMLVAYVNTMNPWVVEAVCLCIFALVLAQIAVIVHEVHKAGLVVFRNEAELAVGNLLVCWYIQGIVVIAVAVDVVHHHVRVVVAAAPCLVDKAQVVAVAVVVGYGEDESVWCHVL